MKELKMDGVVESLIKSAKKSGSITQQEIGSALIDYDLTASEMKTIIS